MGIKAIRWQKTLRGLRNLAMLGFIVSFFLPVDDEIPFGILAAIFSLMSAVSDVSLTELWAFIPNVVISYLIFRFPKNKHWNGWFFSFLSIFTYWGVLLWFSYARDMAVGIAFWDVPLSTPLEKLGSGYWLWNLSILLYLILALIENYSFSISVKKADKKDKNKDDQ